MDEHKEGETEKDIFASLEDRISSTLDRLLNQSLEGNASEMLRRHQAV